MTSPLGQYGSRGYEGPESRTLGKFATDKFSYREQAKNIIELNNAVGYMSGMMRKMQRGIDEANQNFVQQIQGLINDLLVLLGGPGGGGDTGFEFGDLKYVLMALGALFGFGDENGKITLPINLFNAAWYFFSSYILPVQNFTDAINMIVDSMIAGVLDIFGETPILGQALEQLAVIISDIRDLLDPVAASLEALLNSFFDLDLGDIGGINSFGGIFKPIWDSLQAALRDVDLPNFAAGFHIIAQWTIPFIEAIAAAIDALTYIVQLVDGTSDLSKLPDVLLNIFSPLNSVNLFNQVPSNLLGMIPVSQIGDMATNLLENANFESAQSIVNNPGWAWDSADGHSTNGAAVTTANGQEHSIVSNTIGVSQGQDLSLGIWAKFRGLTATPGAGAIRLLVEGYDSGGALVSSTPVAMLASPSGDSSNPGHNDFVELAGSFPVPAGITQAVLVPQVTPAATAGTVKFDDGKFTKSGLMPQNLVENLPADIQKSIVDLQNFMNAVAGKVNALIPDVQNRLKNIKFDGTGLFDASKLFNIAPITAIPTDQLTVSNVPHLGSITDQLTNSLIGAGSQFLGTVPTQARQSMDRLYADVMNLTQKMQDVRSSEQATNVSGSTVSVNFQDFPDGNMSSDWSVTYRGTGSSLIGITSGKAGWRTKVNNGNKDALIVYNAAPSKTNFQIIRGTLANAPAGGGSGGVPKIWSMGRVDNPANPLNYVWCRGRCTGFLSYQGDVGCTIAGVDTVWFANIPLTWSMDITIVIGVNGNPRRYQVYSGTQLIKDWIEPGTASKLNNGTTDPIGLYRYWGAINEIRTDSGGTPVACAEVAGTSMSDNAPPNSVGSTFRAVRKNTALVNVPSGVAVIPNNFFETEERRSDDMTFSPTLNELKVTLEGTYLVSVRYKINSIPNNSKLDTALGINGTLARVGGSAFCDSYVSNSPDGVESSYLVYLKKDDKIIPGTKADKTMNNALTGESSGSETYFEVSLLNYGRPPPPES